MAFNRSQRDALAQTLLGIHVARPTATLPQTTAAAIFTVSGGRVQVRILGEVTTIIQTQTNNTKLTATPTAGTAVDMCAVVDISALEVGGKLVPPGVAATAMTKALAGSIIAQTTPIIVAPGVIKLDCAASNTGSVKWDLFYVPIDEGAIVTAA